MLDAHHKVIESGKYNYEGCRIPINENLNVSYFGRAKRIWYLSPMRAAKVQASLRIRAVSPEPSLLAHTSSESRGTFRQKTRSLAPLNGWACAVKTCHDGMLEDTNSLVAAHLRFMLQDYKDQQLCDFLEFGFPIGYNGNNEILQQIYKKDVWKFKNHKGAEQFPEDLNAYFGKESSNKAIMGPFKDNPFQSGIKISPLNSVPKKDSSERRVILDLSFPKGASLSNFIRKDEYLGKK